MSDLLDINKAKSELYKKKNSPDKLDREDRFWLTRMELNLLQSGQTPLEYLLEVMRDNFSPQDVRMKAANTLMPYVQQLAPRAMELENEGEFDPSILREANIVREKLALLIGASSFSDSANKLN